MDTVSVLQPRRTEAMTEAGWTSKAPTKDGWYWWRNLLTDNAPEVWAIVDHGDGLEVVGPFDETALDEWVSDMGGEWYGPLEVPK